MHLAYDRRSVICMAHAENIDIRQCLFVVSPPSSFPLHCVHSLSFTLFSLLIHLYNLRTIVIKGNVWFSNEGSSKKIGLHRLPNGQQRRYMNHSWRKDHTYCFLRTGLSSTCSGKFRLLARIGVVPHNIGVTLEVWRGIYIRINNKMNWINATQKVSKW